MRFPGGRILPRELSFAPDNKVQQIVGLLPLQRDQPAALQHFLIRCSTGS